MLCISVLLYKGLPDRYSEALCFKQHGNRSSTNNRIMPARYVKTNTNINLPVTYNSFPYTYKMGVNSCRLYICQQQYF